MLQIHFFFFIEQKKKTRAQNINTNDGPTRDLNLTPGLGLFSIIINMSC